MGRFFRWLGRLGCMAGLGLIAAYFVLTSIGVSASYNFGDPAKFEFILVPFWQIGSALVVIGLVFLLIARRFNRAAA